MMIDAPVHILLIEDNEGDIILATEALQHSRINNKITVRKDGESGVEYLKETAAAGNADSLPNLIILDINLPKIDGKVVLKIIKEDELLKHIPVVMFTTSDAESDIQYSYQHAANCYVTKPLDLDEFSIALQKIEDFWFNTVKLP